MKIRSAARSLARRAGRSGLLLGAILAATTAIASAQEGKTLRFAFQGTLNALDPYTFNETFTLGML
ncbi:hypothetical protein AB4144_37835, partial [Rhizobiaceae sp. 2RAB30]